MKKLFLTFLAGSFSLYVAAQTELQPGGNNSSESVITSEQNTFIPQTKAHWDIQQSFDATVNTNGSVGMAGIALFNNEFWVSKWQSDTMMRFQTDGTLISKFLISGLTGVRAITTDGTYLYMATNTTTIYRVNPTTQALFPPHITSSSVNTSRFLTYDQTLNGGAGGFWTGNFNTDIDAISMSGTLLTSLPATTHTLTGMYGAAIDNVSAGGPFLWVFHQAGTNNSQLTAIQLPGGTPTLYSHDAFVDFSGTYSLTSGLAGGAFLTTGLVPGQTSLLGCLQGTPDNIVFALEIDPIIVAEDIAVTSVTPVHGYTQIPVEQLFSETFSINCVNQGPTTIDTLYAEVEYFHNGSLVYTDNLTALGLTTTSTTTLSSTFLPANGKGQYTVMVSIHPNATIIDSDALNDTLSFNFLVTDSVFARDNGIPDGGAGYGVSSTEWAYAMSMYELSSNDTLNGIWIQLANPVQDDTTFAVVYNMAAGNPTTEVALGEITIIDSTINSYYLQFASPIPLAAGMYAFGCYEGDTALINLAQSPNIFTSGTNFFYTPTNGWVASGIMTARFIHPILNTQDISSVGRFDDNAFNIFPIPAKDAITVAFAKSTTNQGVITITDISGRVVVSEVIPTGVTSSNISLSNLNQGTYILSWESGNEQYFRKLVVE